MTARTRPRRADRTDLKWALAVAAIALLHRLLFLHAGYDTSWAFSLFYEGDAEPFFRYARAIIEGRPYDGGVPFHPPAFPYLLSMVHALLGAGTPGATVPNTAVRIVVAVMGSVNAGLVVLVVRGYLGRTAAVLAGLAWAYAFAGYVVSTTPVSETPYQLLLLVILLVWSRRLTHPLAAARAGATALPHERRWAAMLGLLLALLALTRAEGVLVALLIVAVGVCEVRAGGAWRRARLGVWGVVAGVFVLGLVPWTIRNAVRLSEINVVMADRFPEPLPELVPLTAYGPLNLALANNAEANGMFSRAMLPDPTGTGTLDLTRPDHMEVFLRGDVIAWRWIREHPGDFGRLVLRKWSLALGAMRLGWLQWDLPGGLAGVRRPVDCFVPDSPIGAWILWTLVAAGALRLWTDRTRPGRRFLGVVGLMLLVPLVACGLFFGYARLVVVVLPLLYAVAVVPLADLLVWVTRRLPRFATARGTAMAFGTAVLLLAALEGVGATSGDRSFVVSGTLLEGRGVLNPHEPVYIRPARPAAPAVDATPRTGAP